MCLRVPVDTRISPNKSWAGVMPKLSFSSAETVVSLGVILVKYDRSYVLIVMQDVWCVPRQYLLRIVVY